MCEKIPKHTFQSTRARTHALLLKQLHTSSSPAPCQMPIALFQHCSTSLMIAQLPKLPYTVLRGGEICQTGTGPLLTSHITVFDSQLGNCKIKGLGKWNSVTQQCESKQTLPWEVVEEEWTRGALGRNTKVKRKKLVRPKNDISIVKLPKCIIWHLTGTSWALTKRGTASSLHLERESALYKSSFVAPRTVLTSFDINSLWHKMPFSQRCHVFFLSDVTLLMVPERVV